MHPRIDELLAYMARQHEVLLAAVDRVPPDRRDRRPGADRWSVADVLAHLAIVEGRIAAAITSRAAAARATGVGGDPDVTPILPQLDAARFVDRGSRFTSPGGVTPAERVDAVTAQGRLAGAHAALRAAVAAADGVDLATMSMPHAIFGEMNFYRWIAFAAAHEARHAAQIDEIGAA